MGVNLGLRKEHGGVLQNESLNDGHKWSKHVRRSVKNVVSDGVNYTVIKF
jgi:hypothetical protein